VRLTERRRASISEINITPIVDVMFMLLIIFILTAPAIRYGMGIGLPEGKLTAAGTNSKFITQ